MDMVHSEMESSSGDEQPYMTYDEMYEYTKQRTKQKNKEEKLKSQLLSQNNKEISDSEQSENEVSDQENKIEREEIPDDTEPEEKEELEKSIDQNLIETRDPISMRKDNILFFIDIEGKPIEKQGIYFVKHKYFGTISSSAVGEIQTFKRGNDHYICVCIQPLNVLETIWEDIATGLIDAFEYLKAKQIKSISIPKFVEINLITWNRIFGKIKQLITDKLVVTICTGHVTYVPFAQRHDIIEESHNSCLGGHKGVDKCYKRVRFNYYWEHMKEDIQDYIQNCLDCKLKKLVRVRTKNPMAITDTPAAPFSKVELDIVGPLPITKNNNRFILTLQDVLTKYGVAVALPDATAKTIAEAFLRHFICIYGSPRSILTDRGTSFLSNLLKTVAKRLNIKEYRTSSYHAQTNGSLERTHIVLINFLKQYTTPNDHWDSWLEMAMLSYNSSINSSTKKTPYELLQLNNFKMTHVVHCKLEITRSVRYCGWSSYLSIAPNSEANFIKELDERQCRKIQETGRLVIGKTTLEGLLMNNKRHLCRRN